MTNELMSDAMQEALAVCESEPVHIPGCIQPVGALIAFDPDTRRVLYYSENAPEALRMTGSELLSADLRELFGAEGWHDIKNAASHPAFRSGRVQAGVIGVEGAAYATHGFASGDIWVLELEEVGDIKALDANVLTDLTQLTLRVDTQADEIDLLNRTVKLLRTITGYDRVMAYRFDHDFNGEVLAEARRANLDPFVGLNFPHWDIPAQARAIMAKVPLRFISDSAQEPIALIKATATLPELDLTPSHFRGTSPIHLQYLRNMGSQATMTMSIVIEGSLWGMISFHHQRPRIPQLRIRQLCEAFVPILQNKLQISLQKTQFQISEVVNDMRDKVQKELVDRNSLEDTFQRFASGLLEAFEADGIALITDPEHFRHGRCPDASIVDQIIGMSATAPDGLFYTDCINETLQTESDGLDEAAGVLCFSMGNKNALCIFRNSRTRTVRWAGAPQKTVDVVDGMSRLSPRGSFSVFMESVQHHSMPWLLRDIQLVKGLGRSLLESNQWNAMLATARLQKQQELMIDELNHRVRNILAQIRSISRQARQSSTSLDEYSMELEGRINALASAHNAAAGPGAKPVSLAELIQTEVIPYVQTRTDRLTITGPDIKLEADASPLVALIFHELATNAAKHGALSNADGFVQIEIQEVEKGIQVTWIEKDGPPVNKPNRRGFGSTLLERAIPFELGGTSHLTFHHDGVVADIMLPSVLMTSGADTGSIDALDRPSEPVDMSRDISSDGLVLVVEDSFVIASDISTMLTDFGFSNVEIASSVNDARDIIASETPIVGLFDVNLGGSETSAELAHEFKLLGIPFLFSTGYGSKAMNEEDFPDAVILTKPVKKKDLFAQLSRLLS
ncbi:HWE histidine kinase domain-containing protein [Thalassococcus sp. S3]|uniref:HWE histidine kinase domain-containing protein n=1 Tax=Thalassococcus sp. S3 TaxID=2017482 RepID=UPI001024895C|nr:HWE histidine kinase domain-containing protein [Thalassococcus sp. S3]QBF30664.1 hypothetical protein CFI11_05465 [Thalassococcus sp. S3]